jgi:hypothetical protein
MPRDLSPERPIAILSGCSTSTLAGPSRTGRSGGLELAAAAHIRVAERSAYAGTKRSRSRPAGCMWFGISFFA